MSTAPLKLSSPTLSAPSAVPDAGSASPSRRRLLPVLVGVVVAVLTIATATALSPKAVPMRQVLVAARHLAPGTTLTSADWRVALVPTADNINAISAARASTLVGQATASSWSPGTPISAAMLGGVAPADVIGLSLHPGQVPVGLVPGDHVIAVAMSANAATPAVAGYLLGIVQSVSTDPSSGATDANVSVSAAPANVARMITASSAGEVSLVLANG